MMRVLFTYIFPPHPERGGIERVTDLLARELLRRGYEVIYLAAQCPESYVKYDYPAEVFTLPNADPHSEANAEFYHDFVRARGVDIVVNSAHRSCYELFLSQLPSGVRSISVIHSRPSLHYDAYYSIRGYTLPERLYYTVRSIGAYLLGMRRRFWRLRAAELRYIAEHSDFVSLLCESYRDDFMRLVPTMRAERLLAIPNPNTYPSQPMPQQRRREVLFVGRLDMSEKRFDRAVQIWRSICKEFPEWEMIFVGDGECRDHFDRIIRGVDRVRCVGYCDPKPYYERGSILCLVSDYEGFPMVLTEAMLHGVVPICFNSFEAAAEILEGEQSGVLVEPYSIESFARSLRELMRDDVRRETLSKRARRSASRYEVERVVDRWGELFRKNI